ncbi:MAG TPA: hypothetical protein VGF99_21230, partial [Myxococcota bacterium]
MVRALLVMSLLLTAACVTPSSSQAGSGIDARTRRADAEAARAEGLQLLAAGDLAGAVVVLQRCADGTG